MLAWKAEHNVMFLTRHTESERERDREMKKPDKNEKRLNEVKERKWKDTHKDKSNKRSPSLTI